MALSWAVCQIDGWPSCANQPIFNTFQICISSWNTENHRSRMTSSSKPFLNHLFWCQRLRRHQATRNAESLASTTCLGAWLFLTWPRCWALGRGDQIPGPCKIMASTIHADARLIQNSPNIWFWIVCNLYKTEWLPRLLIIIYCQPNQSDVKCVKCCTPTKILAKSFWGSGGDPFWELCVARGGKVQAPWPFQKTRGWHLDERTCQHTATAGAEGESPHKTVTVITQANVLTNYYYY